MGFCVGWEVDSHFLGIYLILILALEHIRYLIASSTDVSNMSTAIFSFDNIVDKFFTEYTVTCNIKCAKRSCRVCTGIYSYRYKGPKQNPLGL